MALPSALLSRRPANGFPVATTRRARASPARRCACKPREERVGRHETVPPDEVGLVHLVAQRVDVEVRPWQPCDCLNMAGWRSRSRSAAST